MIQLSDKKGENYQIKLVSLTLGTEFIVHKIHTLGTIYIRMPKKVIFQILDSNKANSQYVEFPWGGTF